MEDMVAKRRAYGGLRLLDIDDLIILRAMRRGFGNKEIAKLLGLTPPAISHRFLKLRQVFGEDIFVKIKGQRTGRSLLSEKGERISDRAEMALDFLAEESKASA